MACFRNYLIENGQTPDTSFKENDEAALIFFLLYARLSGSARNIHIPADFEVPEEMPQDLRSAHAQDELKFVTGFRCFFVSKPAGYMRDINDFLEYYTPGFASDTAKQIQLAASLRREFFDAKLEDLTTAKSLDRFCDTTTIPRLATADS